MNDRRAARCFQRWQEFVAAQERCGEVNGDSMVPILKRDILEFSGLRQNGVVEQDMEGVPLRHTGSRHALDGRRMCEVAFNKNGIPTFSADQRCSFFPHRCIVLDTGNGRAFTGEK